MLGHVIEERSPHSAVLEIERQRRTRSPEHLALAEGAHVDVREPCRPCEIAERLRRQQEAVESGGKGGEQRVRQVLGPNVIDRRRREDEHAPRRQALGQQRDKRRRIRHVLDDLRGVDEVEAAAGERRAILQKLVVDRDVEQSGTHAAVLGQLDADRVAAARSLPEIDGEAEAAADVEQRARPVVGDRQQRPDRFPDTAARLDVEAPEFVAILIEIAEVVDAGRIVEPAAAARAAHQRKQRMWRRHPGNRQDRSMRAGIAANAARDGTLRHVGEPLHGMRASARQSSRSGSAIGSPSIAFRPESRTVAAAAKGLDCRRDPARAPRDDVHACTRRLRLAAAASR